MTIDTQPGPVRILVFGAALRAGSTNARLASLVSNLIAETGAEVDLARMRDFDMPLYDGDVEDSEGL
ncbi:NADPH-dependent FMN reductase [Streptomyces sp. NPDC127172]